MECATMNNFKIDKQTYSDLNIFTESNDSDSIFNLFKSTRTLGGRERLRAMMRHPFSTLEEMVARKDSIQYFYQHRIIFDVRNEEIDLILHYLKSDKRKSRKNPLDAFARYLTRNSSNEHYIIATGLKYLIRLLYYLAQFIEENLTNHTPQHLKTLAEKIATIIEGDTFKEATQLYAKKLRFYQLIKLDHAFRGKEKEQLYELFEIIYELDVFENVALVALKNGWGFANYNPATLLEINITDLFHPHLAAPIKNSITIQNTNNMVFLTGPNMAGKSSLLKSIGLAVYLSHLGFPVPAKAMDTTAFDGLMTTINLPDNLNDGLSHYYSEVRRVKEVAASLLNRQKMFVILDELFRGTNVKDAYDASLLIISELANINNAVFFISTHIVELAEQLKNIPNISFVYMETFFENKKPVFTYQLKEGISEERLGMYIVENEGIIELIKQAHQKDIN